MRPTDAPLPAIPETKAGVSLCQNEEFYRTLICACPDAIIVTDVTGEIVFASAATAKILGCATIEEIIGRKVLDYVTPGHRAKAAANLQCIITEGRLRDTGYDILMQQGGPGSVEVNAALVHSTEGVGERIIFQVRDVTERKRVELDIVEESVRRRIFIEQSRDGIVVLDMEGKVYESNASFARMLGYSLAEMRQLRVWDWEAQWTRDEALARVRACGTANELFETRHRRKDGSFYDVEVSASGAQCGGQILLYCVCRDISDRKASELALRERQAKLDAILQVAPVGIAVVVNREMLEVNATFCRMLGYTPEELIGRSARLFYASQEDFDHVGREIYSKLDECSLRTVETNWRNKQGGVIQVLASASPIARGALSEGVVFTALDITERKRAEAELARVHKQLVEASREAGMAEVATSVLHNVGNVLNSINVSASLISNFIKTSKTKNVGKVAALLGEHSAALGDYLATDPKGRKLPGYLGLLAEQLTQEQTYLIEEISSLIKNVDHIKDIVAMQQSYARVAGTTDVVKVTDLVEDALRMNASALIRHDLHLFREYDEQLPKITVEKHKVLQILVNLIRNAKQACDTANLEDKRLIVRVAAVSGDTMCISLTDNGVGIPAENLSRIFSHGFTTKKHGHGFGLHSGALAAREMGGSLRVNSDGPGKGATFTLEIPFQPNVNGR